MKSYSFPPIVDENSEILILGTMPGIKSIQQNEYYGHKQNAFWRIIFNIFEEEFTENYEHKKSIILKHKLALWDNLQYCYREGSLDSAIKDEVPNEINELLRKYSKIKKVVFNGQASQKYFKKYIGFNEGISYFAMPSTSPANARMKFEEKLQNWKSALRTF